LPSHAQTSPTCAFLKEMLPAASSNFVKFKGSPDNDRSHLPFEGRQYVGRKIAPGAQYCDVVGQEKGVAYVCVYALYRLPRALTSRERRSAIALYPSLVNDVKGCLPGFVFEEKLVRKSPGGKDEGEMEDGLIGKVFKATADKDRKKGSALVEISIASFGSGYLHLSLSLKLF